MNRFVGVLALVTAGLVVVAPAGAQTTAELVAQAVLPLPEDLRDGAAVYRYDDDTGERIVLRGGTNHVECRPSSWARAVTWLRS
jgi:hypothetical protein